MQLNILIDTDAALQARDVAILTAIIGGKVEVATAQKQEAPKVTAQKQEAPKVTAQKQEAPKVTAQKQEEEWDELPTRGIEEALTKVAKSKNPSASGSDLIKAERVILRTLIAELSEIPEKKQKIRDFMTENCGNPDRFANMDFKYNYELYNHAVTL